MLKQSQTPTGADSSLTYRIGQCADGNGRPSMCTYLYCNWPVTLNLDEMLPNIFGSNFIMYEIIKVL